MHSKVKKYAWFLVGLFAACSVLIYGLGYRLDSSLSLSKRGSVHMTVPLVNTHVFINNKDRLTTKKANEDVRIPLSPGTYEIVLGRDGYYPWKKDVVVQAGMTTTLTPIVVSQTTSGEIITTKDPGHYTLLREITAQPLPSKEKPLSSADNTTRIWVEGKNVMAETDAGIKTVFSGIENVKMVAFYKNRPDVIMLAHATGIYVIDRDTGTFQNFIPLYIGQDPLFMIENEDSMYVKDKNILLRVIL